MSTAFNTLKAGQALSVLYFDLCKVTQYEMRCQCFYHFIFFKILYIAYNKLFAEFRFMKENFKTDLLASLMRTLC